IQACQTPNKTYTFIILTHSAPGFYADPPAIRPCRHPSWPARRALVRAHVPARFFERAVAREVACAPQPGTRSQLRLAEQRPRRPAVLRRARRHHRRPPGLRAVLPARLLPRPSARDLRP